jgi:hypothetical protein
VLSREVLTPAYRVPSSFRCPWSIFTCIVTLAPEPKLVLCQIFDLVLARVDLIFELPLFCLDCSQLLLKVVNLASQIDLLVKLFVELVVESFLFVPR